MYKKKIQKLRLKNEKVQILFEVITENNFIVSSSLFISKTIKYYFV